MLNYKISETPLMCKSERSGKNSPHAYSPAVLLGVWARPTPTPNKLLAGRLALH